MTPITASTSATVSPNDNVESQSRNCDNGSIVFSLLKLWERQVCNPALPTAWIETAEIWRLVIRGPRKNFVNVFANVVASAPPRCWANGEWGSKGAIRRTKWWVMDGVKGLIE
jgi:hypothetical protein